MEIELGSNVKDKVTGMTGIAVSRHTYLNGCVRYSLQRPLDKDGKYQDELNFDVGQLEVLGDKKILVEARNAGGPTGSSVPKGLRN